MSFKKKIFFSAMCFSILFYLNLVYAYNNDLLPFFNSDEVEEMNLLAPECFNTLNTIYKERYNNQLPVSIYDEFLNKSRKIYSRSNIFENDTTKWGTNTDEIIGILNVYDFGDQTELDSYYWWSSNKMKEFAIIFYYDFVHGFEGCAFVNFKSNFSESKIETVDEDTASKINNPLYEVWRYDAKLVFEKLITNKTDFEIIYTTSHIFGYYYDGTRRERVYDMILIIPKNEIMTKAYDDWAIDFLNSEVSPFRKMIRANAWKNVRIRDLENNTIGFENKYDYYKKFAQNFDMAYTSDIIWMFETLPPKIKPLIIIFSSLILIFLLIFVKKHKFKKLV